MKYPIAASLLLVVPFALAVCRHAEAVQLLGDDFTYADGNFDGTQNGGTGSWTSAWTFSGQSDSGIDAWRVLNNQANAPGNELGGNAGRQTGSISRSFTTSEAPNTTMYFSFDMERVNDNEGSYSTYVEFLGGQVAVGVQNDTVRARLAGQNPNDGSRPAAFSSNFIGRIEFDALGDEILTVWENATLETDAPILTVMAELGQSDLGTLLEFDKNGQDNNQFNIDNFQLGTDFDFSAAAVPEPASVAIWTFLGLAGFGYYRTRRKK